MLLEIDLNKILHPRISSGLVRILQSRFWVKILVKED